MRARLTHFCRLQLEIANRKAIANFTGNHASPKIRKVTSKLVTDVVQALTGDLLLPGATPQPCWLGVGGPEQRNYVAVANGLLDVDGLLAGKAECLLSHTPRWFSPISLPCRFDPAADCPRWLAFLDRNFAGDLTKIALLMEWFGYLLLPDTRLQRFLLMVGDGSDGKSVVCAVIEALLGILNISSVPLEMFADKFRLAGTLGKLVNLILEIGELDKIAEGSPQGICCWRRDGVRAKVQTALHGPTNRPPGRRYQQPPTVQRQE